MRSLRNRSSGFTIIELLIVIVVIAILAGLVLNAFGNIQERARDTERQNDINGIHTALELYYTDNGFYPAALDETGDGALDINPDSLVDPNGDDYTYTPGPSGCSTANEDCASYSLSATLEADNSTFSRDSLNN